MRNSCNIRVQFWQDWQYLNVGNTWPSWTNLNTHAWAWNFSTIIDTDGAGNLWRKLTDTVCFSSPRKKQHCPVLTTYLFRVSSWSIFYCPITYLQIFFKHYKVVARAPQLQAGFWLQIIQSDHFCSRMTDYDKLCTSEINCRRPESMSRWLSPVVGNVISNDFQTAKSVSHW